MTAVIDEALVERARAIAPIIEAEADQAEADTTTTQRVVDALTESELFWILVPKEFGGLGGDLTTALSVFDELSYADGSVGWSLMANSTSSCFAAIYTGETAAEQMFPDGNRGIHAGMLGPVGTARRVEGGYRVTGRYSFGSGCAHANYIGAGTIETDDDGNQLTTESGLPAMRVVLVPREEIHFRGNWDVIGLTATGSYDYVIDDVFVPEAFSYSLLEHTQLRGGPGLSVGLFSITGAGHAGIALGVGRRAIDEITKLGNTRVRMAGFATIGTEQLFQYELGMHDCAMRAASALVYEAVADADAKARAGVVDTTAQNRLRAAATYATRVATDATHFAYSWAGSAGLRPSVIQRCLRDMLAASQHIYVDNNTLTGYAQALLADEAERLRQ
ncbi:MAG: acyl-CoA dehydrogenase family protein [Acidimicrobiia bacterium]|nr:acyl-CoA dehydrogenase family protein [Acidimicrobiia bacterium]